MVTGSARFSVLNSLLRTGISVIYVLRKMIGRPVGVAEPVAGVALSQDPKAIPVML